MNKKIKNGSDSSSARVKAVPKKRMTKKDLEGVIKSIEDKQLRLKAEFDNFRIFKFDNSTAHKI